MNPLPSRPTIAERLAAIDALLNQFDAALAEAARASAAIRAILAGEPRPPRYLTAEEAARHVAARLGATAGGDDDGPLFDGPGQRHVPGADDAHEAAAQCPVPLDEGPCMTVNCGHEVAEHELDRGTGGRLHCRGCYCRGYLSPRPGGLTDEEWRARLVIAPGGSAGPASLTSVATQADGSVTAEHPTSFIALPAPTLAGGQ